MAEESDLERTEPASQRRLEQARERGQVPRSPELSTFAVLLAAGGGMIVMGGGAGRQPGKNHARRPDAGPRQRVRHRPRHRAPLRGGGGRAGRLRAAVSAGGAGGDPRADAGERLAVHLPGAAARLLPPQPAQRLQAHSVLAWRDRAWQGAAEDSGHRRRGRLGGVGRARRDRFSARRAGRARTRAAGQPARPHLPGRRRRVRA